MRAPLSATRKQKALLRYIAGYQEAHDGVSPSFAECQKAIGASSKSAISRLMLGLAERGHIRRLRERARAIEIIAAPTIPRAPDGAPLFVVPMFHAASSTAGEQRNHG